MSTMSADQTLDLVRDAEKFKAKIEKLAKAERSAEAAIKKSTNLSKKVFAEMDEAQAKVDQLNATIRRLQEKAAGPIDTQTKALNDREAAVAKDEERLSKLMDKFNDAQDALKRDREGLKGKVVEFDERVASFEAVIISVCESA